VPCILDRGGHWPPTVLSSGSPFRSDCYLLSTPLSTVEKLSAQFSDTFGSDLQSVVLFGSVARGEAIPGVSDVNILVLLSEVTNAGLGLAAPFTQDVGAGRQHSSASVLLGRVAWHGGHLRD